MYIILDLEWNQPFPGQKGKPNAQGMILRTEIIQIGAVKMDVSGNMTDTFSTLVCPVGNKALNPNITRVTGLRREMLADSPSFPEAVEVFREWCGQDCIILTWGRDDLPVFLSNLQYHGCSSEFCEKWYDVQMFFARQNELPKRQYSLKDAVQFYELDLEATLHDAMNDAVYAARICQKLDLEKGIQDAGQPEQMPNETVDPEIFPTDRSAIQKGLKIKYACSFCGMELVQVQPFVRKNQHKLLSIGECPLHGKMTIQIRCWANGKAHWKLGYHVGKMQEEDETRYQKLRVRIMRHREAVQRRKDRVADRRPTDCKQ